MTKNEIIEAWKSGKHIYWYNDISKTKSYLGYRYCEGVDYKRYFDFDRIEYFIEDEGMFGNEYCSMLGINNSSAVKHIEDKLKNASDVYICCIGSSFNVIDGGRTITPTKVHPICNPKLKTKSWRSGNACPIILAKYKKDGSLYSTGVVAYGSTCKTSGDEIMIFETYDECIRFWNKRLEEIKMVKRASITDLENQIEKLNSIAL